MRITFSGKIELEGCEQFTSITLFEKTFKEKGKISLFISNKLIEKLGLKVAYIESGREFYYRNNIS